MSQRDGIRDADGDDEQRQQRDGAEIQARRVGEQRAPRALAEARLEGDEPLELLAPRAGQVVADVRLSRVTATIPAPPGGIDAIERDPDLTACGGAAELLDDAPILIATDEVHAPVGAGRIAPEDVLDLAHALEESTPVECAGKPQTGDRIGHRDLIGGLVLAFDTNGVFRRHLPKGQPLIDVRSQGGDMRPVLADALEQPNDEGQAGRVGDGAAEP